MAKAILDIFNIDNFVIELEEQTRNVSENNFSHTIGWFIAIYPLMILNHP